MTTSAADTNQWALCRHHCKLDTVLSTSEVHCGMGC